MTNNYFEQLELMTKNFDKSVFKGKDLSLVNKVKEALDMASANYELTGEVKDACIKGLPRSYNKINILTPRKNALDTILAKSYVTSFIKEDFSTKKTLGSCFYVDSSKRDAFFIKPNKPEEKGNTSLELDFKEVYSLEEYI